MIKDRRILLSCFIFFTLVSPFFYAPRISADEKKVNNPSYNYSVTPHFGATQKKNTTNFYDMTLPPDGSDTFSLDLINQSETTQEFQVNVNTATTNNNMIVDYTKTQFKKDSSMKLELSKLVKADAKEITLSGKQKKTITFQIKTPKQAFDGILLGSVVVRPVRSERTNNEIQNVFMHTIAIRVNENEVKVSPDLKGGAVRLGQENLHNNVKMTIRNPQSKLMTQVQGTFYITKQGSNKKLVEVQKNNLSIAPNSQFEVPIELKDHFKAGRYEYTVLLKNSEGAWRFKKDFTIKKAEAEEYNKSSIDQPSHSKRNWVVGALLLVIAILLAFIFYLVRRQNKE